MKTKMTRQLRQTIWLTLLLVMGILQPLSAQQLDLLLKGGHVLDPKNGINEVMDVGIADGVIAEVASSISESRAERVIDLDGLYVTPGLIDIHSHHYYGTEPDRYLSNSFTALPPDGFTFRVGLTTVVDVGGAGWRNFRHFKDQVIDRSRTRVLSFLNIVGDGMSGVVPNEQNLNDMDPKMTALVASQYPEVVGIKLAHYHGHDWEPYRRAKEAANQAGVPLMVDFGGAEPPLPLETLFFDIFEPGDILTHAYRGTNETRQPVVDENGNLRPRVLEAQQERGIILDVGHGGGSFLFDNAIPATRQGLWPSTISTDLHTGSMNAGMKDMLNLMSKFLSLGMPLEDVFHASTWKPAQVIQREDLGHLSEGAVADVAVFRLHEGEFGYVDAVGKQIDGNWKLEADMTLKDGRVMWDLNGRAATPWEE